MEATWNTCTIIVMQKQKKKQMLSSLLPNVPHSRNGAMRFVVILYVLLLLFSIPNCRTIRFIHYRPCLIFHWDFVSIYNVYVTIANNINGTDVPRTPKPYDERQQQHQHRWEWKNSTAISFLRSFAMLVHLFSNLY